MGLGAATAGTAATTHSAGSAGTSRRRRWMALAVPLVLVAASVPELVSPAAASAASAASASSAKAVSKVERRDSRSSKIRKARARAAARTRQLKKAAPTTTTTLPPTTTTLPATTTTTLPATTTTTLPATTTTTTPPVTVATAPPTTAPTVTIATAPPTTAPTTTAPVATRDPRLWPFASTSPWNTPIGTGASFASTSDPRYANLVDPWTAINAQSWSMATYVATTSDPVRTVTSHAGSWQYRIPNDAVPSAPVDGDRHLLVIDPSGQYVDECWLASKQADGNWWCEYHVRNDVRGAGVLENGVRAYGGSALGGLMRTWEIQQGSIRHALAAALPRSDLKHGPVWPASSEDGDATYGGSTPMGSLFAIPSNVDLGSLGLSAGGLAIARAMRDFGVYIVDASSNFTLYAEPSAESLLTGARADLDKIRAQLRPVTNNTSSTPGGGGTPITSTAPAIAG